MDVFGLLSQDHTRIHTLFSALEKSTHHAEKKRLFGQLKHELDQHTRIEEELFYPELLYSPRTGVRVREALHEHGEIKTLMMQVDALPPADPAWQEGLHAMQHMVNDHIHDEESQIFPLARQALSSRLQEDLLSRVRRRREELMDEARRSEARRSVRLGGMQFAAEQARHAAGQIHGVAEALRETVSTMGEQDQAALSGYLKGAADGLDYLSSTLDSGDVDALARRAAEFARRQPLLFVGASFATGFVLSRLFKSGATPSDSTGEMH